MIKKLLPTTSLITYFSLVVQDVKQDTAKWGIANPSFDFNYKSYRYSADEGAWVLVLLEKLDRIDFSSD